MSISKTAASISSPAPTPTIISSTASADFTATVFTHPAFPFYTILWITIVMLFDHYRLPISTRVVGWSLFLLFAFLLWIETHTVAGDLIQLAWEHGRALFSPSGISAFCVDLQKIAQVRMLPLLVLIGSLYLTLQTFCIPGTVALNAAIGALIGTNFGVPLAALLGTFGATCCFLLGSVIGLRFVDTLDKKLMKGRGIAKLRLQVQQYRSDLLVYMLFLRLTPVLPNWLVNLASPLVGVPMRTFVIATFFGILPQTYLSVRFGSAVVDLSRQRAAAEADRHGSATASSAATTMSSIVTTQDTIFICCLAIVVVLVHRLRKRFQATA